ncbi:MAG: Lrp/AsnC family transcriptional regulator [Candidatus Bathyarchaeia archaeon]
MTIELDEIDRKIIEILKKDARKPFTNIGKDLGISDATVHVRIKKLIDEGVIKGYTVDVDRSILGRGICGFALLKVKPGQIEKVAKSLVNEEDISAVYELHGPSDLLIKVDVKDLDELREKMLKIRKMSKVTASELITVLKTWKEE